MIEMRIKYFTRTIVNIDSMVCAALDTWVWFKNMIFNIFIPPEPDRQREWIPPRGAGAFQRCAGSYPFRCWPPGRWGIPQEEPDVRGGAWWKHGCLPIDTEVFQYFNNCPGHLCAFGPHVSLGQTHLLIRMDAVGFVAGRESLHFKLPQIPLVGWSA